VIDVVTGGGGFLGWHVRALRLARGLGAHRPAVLGEACDPARLAAVVDGADRVLHLAGVNRGPADAVHDGNVQFARQLADALLRCDSPPATVVFADSIRHGDGTPYGEGKRRAAELLHVAADRVGSTLVDLHLPNLFGEHGRPDHNSVVATFCDRLARGEEPRVEVDRELDLLPARVAAEVVLGERPASTLVEGSTRRRVSEVLGELVELHRAWSGPAVPALDGGWRRDLGNALRASWFRLRPVTELTGRADARGTFTELLRSPGGGGQTSFSTTAPGVTRGQHFHRRKAERFCVVGGEALIRLRRVLTDELVEIAVSGDRPVAVDMPTLWAHSITAVGDRPVQTVFWVDEPFDPTDPDTFQEDV